MSTRLHRFILQDVNFIPASGAAIAALDWLRTQVDARRIEVISPGHVIFFDCGGGLESVSCPFCKTDTSDPFWKDWMDASYGEATGFALTSRALPCCGANVRLDQLIFDTPCAFGSFAIEITDTMTNVSDAEMMRLMRTVITVIGTPLIRLDAHY